MTGPELATPRRGLIIAAAGGAALALAACAKAAPEPDVSATEDLMREHGVLRRILVVFRESAAFVRSNFSSVDGKQIWRAAELFRRFGEAYHEQELEERHIFPQVMKAGGEAAALVPLLIAQHARGRQITAYVQEKTAAGAISGTDAGPLAIPLEASRACTSRTPPTRTPSSSRPGGAAFRPRISTPPPTSSNREGHLQARRLRHGRGRGGRHRAGPAHPRSFPLHRRRPRPGQPRRHAGAPVGAGGR